MKPHRLVRFLFVVLAAGLSSLSCDRSASDARNHAASEAPLKAASTTAPKAEPAPMKGTFTCPRGTPAVEFHGRTVVINCEEESKKL